MLQNCKAFPRQVVCCSSAETPLHLESSFVNWSRRSSCHCHHTAAAAATCSVCTLILLAFLPHNSKSSWCGRESSQQENPQLHTSLFRVASGRQIPSENIKWNKSALRKKKKSQNTSKCQPQIQFPNHHFWILTSPFGIVCWPWFKYM